LNEKRKHNKETNQVVEGRQKNVVATFFYSFDVVKQKYPNKRFNPLSARKRQKTRFLGT